MHVSTNVDHVEMRFRQLCCVTDGGQLGAELVFRALHYVLPFSTVLYTWLGPLEQIDSYHDSPHLCHCLRQYYETIFNKSESELWATPLQAATTEYGPHHVYQLLRVSHADFHRHPIYNEILRPAGHHTFVRIMFREAGVPVGVMAIGREARDLDFNETDLRLLTRLEPFLARALALRTHPVSGELCDGKTAMLVVDRTGRICWQSESAATLLCLAQGNSLASPELTDGLIRTVRALNSIARGQTCIAAPEWHTTNRWGTFSARPYWLQPQEPGQSFIGLILEHKVPMSVLIDESLMNIELPLRQMQVCRLLALGRTENQIAAEMGLSQNTVVYHRRQIYCALGIDSRKELLEYLLAQTPATGDAPRSHRDGLRTEGMSQINH